MSSSSSTSVVQPGFWQRARKFLVALLGFAASAVAAGIVPEPYDQWVTVAVAGLTALGVYRVPNARVV